MPRPLLLLLVVYTVMALAYNLADPLFEPPDERLHYDFIRYVQTEHRLPVARLTDPPSEFHQPPAYYVVAAVVSAWLPRADYADHVVPNPFWAADFGVGRDNKNQFLHGPNQQLPQFNTALTVHLLRLLSTLAGAVTVYLTYSLCLALLPGHNALALAASAVTAFTPNFLLTSAAITNDGVVSMAPAGLMLLMFRLLDQRATPSARQWLGLSVCLGLTLLVKVSAYPLAGVAAALAAIWAWRRSSFRVFLTAGVLLSSGVLVVSGWWFVRNLVLYGDLTGLGQMWQIWGTRPPLTLAQLRIEAWNLFTTFWANFGYGNVPVPNIIYFLLAGLVALSVVGLLWSAADVLRQRARPMVRLTPLALVGLWMAATTLALGWYLQRTLQVTGRQIFAILPAIAFCLVWGWSRLVPRRWHTWLASTITGGMFVFALYSLIIVLIPAYSPNPRLPLDAAVARMDQRLDWRLGDDFELLGYRLEPSVIEPSQIVQVTLFWRSLRPTGRNYTVFVHLLGAGGEVVGSRDTYPGLGNDPTLYWAADTIIEDTIPVRVAPTSTGPLLLDIEAGLYDLPSGQRVPITTADGSVVNQPVIGHLTLAAPPQMVPSSVPLAVFEGGVSLLGYRLEPAEPRAGQPVTLTLQWAAAGPLLADYTVFVQLIDSAGSILAQGDGPPRGGRYPSTVWAAGDVFSDEHQLDLPANLPSGYYVMLVGLYNREDNQRLLTGSNDHVSLPITLREP